MKNTFPRLNFYPSIFWMLIFSIFFAPPLFVENAEWAYRRNWLITVFPLAILIAVAVIKIPRGKIATPAKIFSSHIPGILFAIGIGGPLLLSIPTLNGQMEGWVLQQIVTILSTIGKTVFPAIKAIQSDNIYNFSNTQILKAQAVHSYTYISFTIGVALYAYTSILGDPVTSKYQYSREMPFKWMNSPVIKIPMFAIMIFAGLMCCFGWGLSECTDTNDIFVYTNCALGDDLLLFFNAHVMPFGMFLSFAIAISLLKD